MDLADLLTGKAISRIIDGENVEEPIVQICNQRMVNTGGQPRCRVQLSDGQHSTTSAMLASQLMDLVENGSVSQFAIVKLLKFMLNTTVQGKKILIILNMEVIRSGADVGCKVGDPVPYDSSGGSSAAAPADNRVPLGQRNIPNRTVPNAAPQMGAGGGAASQKPLGMPGVHPIAAITPYQNKWTICARVTNKSDIRTWSNSRGEGKLFSMDLLDESGEIRATAFNDQCDKFYNLVEINKVYYISQAQLKTANKQFTSLKNDYEMTFNQGTQVAPCQEEVSIPTLQFDFVSLEQLERVEAGTTIDVIGVCHTASEMSVINSRTTGKEIKKRDITIIDDTNREISLTFWGTFAETFDGTFNPVVAVKGVKVSDFSGKSLSTLSSSTIQLNPDIRESHKLRAWYDSAGGNLQSVKLSAQKGSLSGFGNNFKTLKEAVVDKLGHSQADYYSTKAVVSTAKKENCMYQSCPSESCNKKVVDMNNGMYRCEKCAREYDSFNWRLMLTVCLADGTESVWVTMFQDQAESLLGVSSDQLGSLKDNDTEAFDEVFSRVMFKECLFKLRVKMEVYNEESRLKTAAVGVYNFDPLEYNKKLVEEINRMMSFQ